MEFCIVLHVEQYYRSAGLSLWCGLLCVRLAAGSPWGAARSLPAFASSPACGFAPSPAFGFARRSLVRRPLLPQPGSPAASRRPPLVALAPVGARRLRRRPRPSDSAAGG